MKRKTPPPSRHGGFLSQKKIRAYMEPLNKEAEEVTPLKNAFELCYQPERGNPLTAELRHAMQHAVQDQLEAYKKSEPLVCAFNKEHKHTQYVASHYIRYFEDLCNAFLKMFSSFRLPVAYAEDTGGFLPEDEQFEQAWTKFHQKAAKLRILCRMCHLECLAPIYKLKKTIGEQKKPLSGYKPLSVNEVLLPYKHATPDHPWLDLSTWGAPTDKGNYSRKLGTKQFTLFQRDGKWRYAYDNKFGETAYDTLSAALRASYMAFSETIRRYA